MAKLGIMGGRLVPPEPGRFQAFPRERWAEEFSLAAAVPLTHIEWIHDAYGVDVNPLFNDLASLRARSEASGVALRSICADFFMDYPFVRCSQAACGERRSALVELMHLARRLGAERIVVPFVDASRIATVADGDRVVELLEQMLPATHETGVELHLETSLAPLEFAALLQRVPDPRIKVNYDTGNSAALGYHPRDEFAAYGNRIGSVHIKDRALGGTTMPLGTGDTDFAAVFAGLRELSYAGDFTLQVARGSAGDEVAWARENRAFVAQYWALE